MINYWLMKTEPSVYSINDLKKDKQCFWEGVRNYQARNYLRDSIKKEDRILIYHSNQNPPATVGTAIVIKEGYADHTAWDKESRYYDSKSSKENPRWFMVDLAFEKKFQQEVSLELIKKTKSLEGILVAQKGSRLSVQPVTQKHFKIIEQIGNLQLKN